MVLLQILTITVLFIIVILSVVIGSRAQQKERELTERRFKQMQLTNRADRIEQHVRGLVPINTDNIVTDVFLDFYLDCLRELLDYTDDAEKVEARIAAAEAMRDTEPNVIEAEPSELSFQEKSKYKERLTKAAKMLLYMRRKGRISHTHYKLCYDYLRWLNVWLQLNRQLVQAAKNFHSGDMRVAQTLYGVVHSHLKSNNLDRPEKKELETFVNQRIQDIMAPQIMALQNSEHPEEALADLLISMDGMSDAELLGEAGEGLSEPQPTHAKR